MIEIGPGVRLLFGEDQGVISLARLEHEMHTLVVERERTVSAAQSVIAAANRNFDKAAVPLARKINRLREQVEAQPTQPKTPPTARYPDPDPEWSQEEIDHYHELRLRGNKQNGKSARR